MKQVNSPETPDFSRSQRCCHLLLMLCLPGTQLTPDEISRWNHVETPVTRQDITEAVQELQRYSQLEINRDPQGYLHMHGAVVSHHLCFLHTLRRALRISPEFVSTYFVPILKRHLQQSQISKALYDECNIQSLIRHCAQQLQREFSPRDCHFLQIYLQYLLIYDEKMEFTPAQIYWLSTRAEYTLAREITRCWQKQGWQQNPDNVARMLALLFIQIYIPDADHPAQHHEQRLLQAVQQLIQQFQHLSGMQFSNYDALRTQLFTHLSQALERIQFMQSIDPVLVDDVAQQYPRLLRTTRAALVQFEQHFSLRFPEEEIGLVAIIFGAWLMQDGALQEKQILLLTGCNRELEQKVEQQIRELTLLPLAIKYQPVEEYQRNGAPGDISLVITPYSTTLPLFSPPLIHTELPLGKNQQQSIRSLLES